MRYNKILIIMIFLMTFSYSNIKDEFPSYKYIFTQLDIDLNYINNKDFISFVNKNKNEFKKRFLKSLKEGYFVVPTLKNILKQEEILSLVLYLSMVESGLKLDATSTSQAYGLWQFIPSTAKYLDLKINDNIDERLDIIKSTKTALKYLNKMNARFQKWYLSIMAYNFGEGATSRGIIKTGSSNIEILLDKNNHNISHQAKKYLKKIILMAMIGENYLFKENDIIGSYIHNIKSDILISVETKTNNRISRIANTLNINPNLLQYLNSHIKSDKLYQKRTYSLNIPNSKKMNFKRMFHPTTFNKKNLIYYNVKRGDSLRSISRKLRIDILDIEKVNSQVTVSPIYIGQVLLLPKYN